jgi:hypothetical protein
VSDEHTRCAAERFDQLRDIFSEDVRSIRLDAARFWRIAVAAKIGSDRAKSGSGEGGELQLPRMPRLREAMKEDDERPVALLVIVQFRTGLAATC